MKIFDKITKQMYHFYFKSVHGLKLVAGEVRTKKKRKKKNLRLNSFFESFENKNV